MTYIRPPAVKWLLAAHLAVLRAYPNADFSRESPEITKAADDLEWALHTHFVEFQTNSLDKVQEAWRVYYKLMLPGQQSLI